MDKPDPQFTYPRQARLLYTRVERGGLATLGLFLLLLLAVAAWLDPNPAGLGTHTQLGLPGCTMFTFLGIRCPGCGMTTSWAHAMNGDFASALQCSMSGVLLCVITAVAAPLVLCLSIRGKPFPGSWFSTVLIAAVLLAVGISFFEWMIRLALH